MYGLKQASHIAFDRIEKVWKPNGYDPLRSNPGIWFQQTVPTKCTLCVDNFGIKYTNTDHAHHLVYTLKNTTHYLLIGEGEITMALIYIGIMTRNNTMYQCLDMLHKPFTSSNIQHLRDLNIPRMTGMPHPMAQ